MSVAADIELEQVDLLDPALWVDGPPHELFARMRAQAPVRWNALPGGDGFWSLTRHADVAAVSKDPATWSSWRAGIFMDPDQVISLDISRNLLLYKDPPEHTKYRMILQRRFTPKMVSELEPAVRACVVSAIERVADRGECDFVTDIAVPVPLGVLARLMGLPARDIPVLTDFTSQIEIAQRAPYPNAAAEDFVKLAAYLHEQIAAQVQRGEEDSLVMQLRQGEVDGEELDDTEILVFFGLLVFAGNDTTRNTSSSGLLALLQNPDQMAALRAGGREAVAVAVDEILRWTSVVNYFVRTATCDTELPGGHAVGEGQKAMLWYCSASRDEAVFEEPQAFDVGRGSSDHFAFGGGGRHFCLGSSLAKLTLRVLFEEVLERWESIELAGDVERVVAPWSNSLTSLPVRFQSG